MIMVDILM